MYRVGGKTFLLPMYLSPFSGYSDAFLCAIVSPCNFLSKRLYNQYEMCLKNQRPHYLEQFYTKFHVKSLFRHAASKKYLYRLL